ncbi:MAG: hypothetical protein ACTSU4_07280 [Promethearchaeota archaeon]
MYLLELSWDDSSNLIFEFEKEGEEKKVILPETVDRINIKFEISMVQQYELGSKPPPYLVSVKEVFFTEKTMCFLINLRQLNRLEELKITILKLTIFFVNGNKVFLSFNEKYKFSEIQYRGTFYKEDYVQNYSSRNNIKKRITQEKVFKEVLRDFNKNTQKTTYVYQKNQIENTIEDSQYFSLIKENNERLKRVEEELKTISALLKNARFNGSINYSNLPSVPSAPPSMGITRIKRPPKRSTGIQQNLVYLSELKTVLKKGKKENNEFNFREILKPLSEEELNKITLSDEELIKKQEIAVNNQLKRLKKEEEKVLRLEDLRKPT